MLYATQDSVGNYWLGQRADAIKVYRPDGSFLRQVGRSGQGPMEFINPAPIHTDGEGHVHVLDNSNLRHTIVNAAFELESETRLPAAVVDAFPLNDGRQFVVNMQFNTASELGHPLHVIKGDEILRSFGMDSRPGKNPLDPIETRRELGADKQGIVYSAKRYDYTLDAWTSDGERIVGFERIGLNPDPILSGSWGPHNPPPNRLFSIRPFNDHLVWVLSWIRDEDWQARMEERIAPNGAVMLVPENEDLHSIYSSVIEMVDFARGEVIARSVQDKLPYAFIARDLAIENGFTEEGHPRAMVWRVTYSNPSRR